MVADVNDAEKGGQQQVRHDARGLGTHLMGALALPLVPFVGVPDRVAGAREGPACLLDGHSG